MKQISKNKALSELHQKALSQLERMSDEQVKAVLEAFTLTELPREVLYYEETKKDEMEETHGDSDW